jgi:alpha-L-fucosidase
MHRKDFQALAAVLNRNLNAVVKADHKAIVETVAHEMADYFATTSPNFDRTRFLTAALDTDPKNLRAIVVDIERGTNSVAGNPTWTIVTLAGARYKTKPNVSFAYEVGQHMLGKVWEFEMDSRNRIVTGKEVNPE